MRSGPATTYSLNFCEFRESDMLTMSHAIRISIRHSLENAFVVIAVLSGSMFAPVQSMAQEFDLNSGANNAQIDALDNYRIDNAHTSLVFAVSHFNLSYTYGRFDRVSGEFDLDGTAPSRFVFIIESSGINTNSSERDEHLRSVDFFDVVQFPDITFESIRIDQVDETYNVTGNITMLGTTKEITIPMQMVGMGQGPFGKTRAGYFAKFTIKRSEFGMEKMLAAVGDNISITFSFEGIKREPGDPVIDLESDDTSTNGTIDPNPDSISPFDTPETDSPPEGDSLVPPAEPGPFSEGG